ncbi:MAG: hypothetical protein K2K13_00755 [Clostridiales bacterium]|nr:hypothetical protein [Clostridiales bacterium]MDE6617545.1 hypothetical protein [Clostridiales bacterium]
MTRKTGELKKRCWLAKQRLKMGYFDSLKQENRQDESVPSPIAEYSMRVGRLAEVAASTSATEEKMYRKVCDILDSSEIALNPIGQLIERDVYDGLDANGKQRYVLELSEKFRELQERYYRERTGS